MAAARRADLAARVAPAADRGAQAVRRGMAMALQPEAARRERAMARRVSDDQAQPPKADRPGATTGVIQTGLHAAMIDVNQHDLPGLKAIDPHGPLGVKIGP